MKRWIFIAAFCAVLCMLSGCRKTAETDEINVVSNIGGINVFADEGCYHSNIHSISYIDQQHQGDKKDVVYTEDTGESRDGMWTDKKESA